jgi:hypothetical protein
MHKQLMAAISEKKNKANANRIQSASNSPNLNEGKYFK